MLQTLTLLKGYNNYYNRKYKYEGDYISDYAAYTNVTLSESNFNPNDGVDTTHVFNGVDVGKSDYLLVSGTGGRIDSRWFVIESERNRQGQYTLTLHRDLAADFKDDIDGSTAFIEKATIIDESDSAIFNNENMDYNQIKQSEQLLKDRTNTAWIVGYIARDTAQKTINITSSISAAAEYTAQAFPTSKTIKVYRHDLGCNNTIRGIRTGDYLSEYKIFNWAQNLMGGVYDGTSAGSHALILGTKSYNDILSDLASSQANFALTNYVVNQAGLVYSTNEEFKSLKKQEGKIVKYIVDDQVRFYNVSCTVTRNKHTTYSDSGQYINKMSDVASTDFDSLTSSNCSSFIYYDEYVFKYIMVTNSTYTLDIPSAASRKHLQDAPYDMFCIPLEGTVFASALAPFISYPEFAINVAQELATQLSDACYDMQLLPYCPLTEDELEVDAPTTIHPDWHLIPNGTDGSDFSIIYDTVDSEIPRGCIMWCSRSSGTFDISDVTIDVVDVKVENECDTYRLCSPNYNGVFEFNAAKNGGVAKFNVDWQYKPINPYIHVNPDFGRLYGSDFNDSRGLICGGDYSLARVSDAWTDYELRNKNYQLSFDRQIQNMELNNKMGLISDITNAVVGTATGAVTGAAMGGGMGGGAGAIAGGAISAIGGVADIAINQTLRNENVDYTKDQFGYSMGNIKALPNSLSKVSAFNPNNRYFPFLEYYTCTDEEKQALRDKITYNGMTVMRIGKIGDYINNGGYFKCRLIRCDTIQDDYHLIKAISDELMKGVFV